MMILDCRRPCRFCDTTASTLSVFTNYLAARQDACKMGLAQVRVCFCNDEIANDAVAKLAVQSCDSTALHKYTEISEKLSFLYLPTEGSSSFPTQLCMASVYP